MISADIKRARDALEDVLYELEGASSYLKVLEAARCLGGAGADEEADSMDMHTRFPKGLLKALDEAERKFFKKKRWRLNRLNTWGFKLRPWYIRIGPFEFEQLL